MACSHRKRHELAQGSWRDSKNVVVILRCGSCGALRLDQYNVYVYQQGQWSLPWRKAAK